MVTPRSATTLGIGADRPDPAARAGTVARLFRGTRGTDFGLWDSANRRENSGQEGDFRGLQQECERMGSAPEAASCNSSASRRFGGQSGKATLKAVVWTVILVTFVYVSAVTLPVFISEYEFQDSLQDIARYASVNRRNPDQIKQAVIDEAQKDNLPIQPDSVKVEGSGGNVKINVDYTVTVDLKFYEWTLDFHPNASNSPL